MRHRGPDSAGYRTFISTRGNFTSLLFTRLRIIDLDPRADQPMRSHGVWVTLNGEIYNYREVRKTLEDRGVQFRTESDTEVLLEGYRAFGWAVLDMLEGMWAFALYETSTGRLSLCRDRFGEKPLYFTQTEYGIAYASETNSLSALTGIRFQPDVDHVSRFLVNGYKSLYKSANTFFKGVNEIGAGTIMHVNDDGSIETSRYWNPGLEIDEDMDFEQAVEGTRQHLQRAVEIRLRADVPLAFSLSGGVDSVALASIARREIGADITGFTILNSDPRYDERELVQHVVSSLGIDHTGVELDTRGFLERLRTMVIDRGAPLLTISHYIQWLLMEEIGRRGYRVIVGGAGADEMFSGYYDHHLLYVASLDQENRSKAIQDWERLVKPHVRNPFLQDPARFVADPHFRDHIYLGAEQFASFLGMLDSEPFTERSYHPTILRNRMLNELFHESIPVIMHEEDLNAMHFSIENRSPFLDRGLMEFAQSIPTRLLIRNGRAKAPLREAVRGIAPDRILDNPRKVGFNAPITNLLDLDRPRIRKEVLADSPIYDLVNWKAVSDLIERRQLPNSESKFLFSFLSCKAFLEEFD